MEQWEFFIREAINRPEIELKVRSVFEQNTALREENAELKDELAVLSKEKVQRRTGCMYLFLCGTNSNV